VRKLSLTALLAIGLAAPAFGFSGTVNKRGDLDGDSYRELVYTAQVDLPDVDTEFDPTVINVNDRCESGDFVDERISGRQDNVVTLKLRKIDTRKGREVFFDMRSGASARQGEARVVAWRKHSGATCRRARDLFKYRSTHPTHPPRGTNGEVSSFDVKVRERARRFRGKEVVLSEVFTRPGDPLCCGTVRKLSYWRYSRARDKYIRYKTKIKRRRPTS
jgi:hypothetical protein